MEPTGEMCQSLLKWFQSVVSSNKPRTVDEIFNGVAILEALIEIEPNHFNKLEAKIKKDGISSWIRVSNMKKFMEAILEYYQDVLMLTLLESGRPDVVKIGTNNDYVELAKLLRLILGCAINCERKQDYITKIMKMEESVQRNIMQAIQQLDEVSGSANLSLLILDSEPRVQGLLTELEAANIAKEDLIQHCQKLEAQIQILIEEKQAILNENHAIKEKQNKSPDMRRQCEELKEELFKSEVIRDDLRSKLDDQQRELRLNQERIAELQIAANETAKLKDELDALSESAVKVQNLETIVSSYKDKLEKYSDFKKNFQKLEEKNVEYLQKNLEYEEELSKTNTWKNQCESLKKQLSEVEQKLDEETQRADKAQFTCENLEARLQALQGEKDRALQDRDILREENEELKVHGRQSRGSSETAMAEELTPTEMKERMRHLEKENRTLRTSIQEHDANKTLLENALARIDKLQQQKRANIQTVLKLEAEIDEIRNSSANNNHHSAKVDLHGGNTGEVYAQKITLLQEELASKDAELQVVQAKYAKNLEKAREVAQHFQLTGGGKVGGGDFSLAAGQMKETEQKLMATALHRLCMNCHKEAMDERLAVLSAGQGQSFLARQRQATARKPIAQQQQQPQQTQQPQRFKSK